MILSLFHRRVSFWPLMGLCIAAIPLITGQAGANPPSVTGHALRDPEFVKSLTPYPSSPGVVVCDPVMGDASPGLADFSIGCARWLNFAIGSQPEFGRTPPWSTIQRVRNERKKPDLRLSLAEARGLANSLGITHVMLGTVSGTVKRCRIRYQLYMVPAGKPVGRPVEALGSEDEIISGLPDMARKIAVELGCAAPHVPAAVGATPAELALTGHFSWTFGNGATEPQKSSLRALASRFPLAGLQVIEGNLARSGTEIVAAVDTLLTQAPGNPIVYLELAEYWVIRLYPHREQLAGLCRNYPHNSLFAYTESLFDAQSVQREAEEASAERGVRCAPGNPVAWILLGHAENDLSESVRYGRFYSDLSAEEIAKIEPLYPRCLDCDLRAVELDPNYGRGWLGVSEAAAFNGEGALAERAYSKAVSLDPDPKRVYWWGMQLYQPKWFDNKAKLDAVVKHAANMRFTSADDVVDFYGVIYWAGYIPLAQKLYDRVQKELNAAIAKNPKDARAHHELAVLLKTGGSTDERLIECQAYARLQPDSASAHFQLAEGLSAAGRYEEAIREYREAIRLDPQVSEYYSEIGFVLKFTNHATEAEQALIKAIHIEPDLVQAHVWLGGIYTDQARYPEAIAACLRLRSFLPAIVPPRWPSVLR